MDKTLKFCIIVGILIVSSSVFYFLVIYLPQDNAAKALALEIAKCSQMGNDTFEKEQKPNSTGAVFLNPQYKYFPSTGQCLYRGGVLGSGYITEYINDLYTNKEVVSYTIPLDQTKRTNDDTAAHRAFMQKSAELFGSD